MHLSPEEQAIRQEMIRHIRQAIDDLPPAEREAVLLVYLGELSHKEAALQLGATPNGIKVRVHRGRERLRLVLQAEFGPSYQPLLLKEKRMIKVSLHDILRAVKHEDQQPSASSTDMTEVVAAESLHVVVLQTEDTDQVLPIWIGPFEAASLAMYLKQQEVKRPMTYDLTKTLLALGQVSVERTVIGRLHETTYYSNLIVKTGSSTAEVDCRPSDAINLALRIGAPIYVATEVMAQSGVAPDGIKPPDNPAYRWQSVLTPDAPSATHSPSAAPAPTQ